MLGDLTATQWADWVAFMAVEPYGDAAMDARIGYVLSALVALLTGKQVPPEKLAPAWGGRSQPWREMFAVIQRQADAYHRKDKGQS